MSLSQFFQDNLIEILLSIILVYNIGAYQLLQRRINQLSEEVENNTKFRNMIMNRLFGFEEDETSEGYVEQSEDRFDSIDAKLNEIYEKLDEESQERKHQFSMIEGQIDQLASELSKEDSLDFDEEDIDIYGGKR